MKQQKKKQQLLLLEDVYGLGKKGDIVRAKSGYIRNKLLPEKLAVGATEHTLKMQDKLQEERKKQAVLDREESEALSERLKDYVAEIHVNVDPEGHLYGSVSSSDIAKNLAEKGFIIDRKSLVLAKPIKSIGEHKITATLKEGVVAYFKVQVIAEQMA